MAVKYIIPNIKETFGTLKFAGVGKDVEEGVGRNRKVVARYYNLFSDVQRSSTSVLLPIKAGKKEFEYEKEVILVNPKITVETQRIGDESVIKYTVHAEDLKEV